MIRPARNERGFTLLEMLVGLAVTLFVMSGMIQLLLQNARLNKAEQMTTELQTNARSCLDMVVPLLRSAGWDPTNAGIPGVLLDPDETDGISQIEVLGDFVEPPDGMTDGDQEHILIRHIGDRVEWRRTPSSDFETIASGISNDADGDGTSEPLFVAALDDAGNPIRVTVRITAESPDPHPVSGELIRYTVTSDVVLRTSL